MVTAVTVSAAVRTVEIASDATVVSIVAGETAEMTKTEKPPHVVTREATRVGAEAGAARMTADTHDVTEEAAAVAVAMETSIVAAGDATAHALAPPTATIAQEMTDETVTTAPIPEEKRTTASVAAVLPREMPLLS